MTLDGPPRVVRTLQVGDEPWDIVFGGTDEKQRAFVATAIGRGGMFLATDSTFEPEHLHGCELILPEVGTTLRVHSEIVYRTQASGRDAGGLGMRFEAFPDGDESVLIQYLGTL